MTKIVPKKNQKEFAHYHLQIDFREFYLSFRQIQDLVQSTTFSKENYSKSIKELERLLVRSVGLNKRFKKLFASKLYDTEIEKLNKYRNKKIILLHQRLTRDR